MGISIVSACPIKTALDISPKIIKEINYIDVVTTPTEIQFSTTLQPPNSLSLKIQKPMAVHIPESLFS